MKFFDEYFYSDITSLVRVGYSKPLQQEDLLELRSDHRSQKLADDFDRLWAAEQESTENNVEGPHKVSTYQVLKRQIGKGYFSIGIFHLIQAAANIMSPLFIGYLTKYASDSEVSFRQRQAGPPLWLAASYAGGLFLLQEIASLSLNRYFHHSQQYGIKVKTCLTVVIYRKLMRLSSLSRQRYSTGQITNIISSDCPRLEQTLYQLHYVWSGPLQIITILALLIYLIGPSALTGLGIMILLIPVQAMVFIKLGLLRRAVAGTTDARIKLTQEFLQGMRIIKLFAWEESFLERVMDLRKSEVSRIRFVNMWQAVLMGISMTVPVFATVISLIVYVAVGGELQPSIIFPALAFFSLMRMPLMLVPSIIRLVTESKVALSRIDDVLNAEELVEVKSSGSAESEYAIEVKNGKFQWEVLPESEKPKDDAAKETPRASPAKTIEREDSAEELLELQPMSKKEENVVQLRNINLKIKKGSLVAIVGGVGSGKTSLLNAILGEMKTLEGSVSVNGSIGYTLQQPWIKNGTLLKNIIFGQDFDEAKFEQAVDATALTQDLEWLPAGRETLLGEKGVQASGGQKARISLARIVYGKPAIAFLDDPLSAVDIHTGKHLFEKCIKQSLKNCTVVLVTHHLSYLRHVDHIVMMKDGTIVEQGTYNELMAAQGELSHLVTTYVGKEEEKAEESTTKVAAKKATTKVLKMTEDERVVGSVSRSVYASYIKAAGLGHVAFIFFLAIAGQVVKVGNDLWLVNWSKRDLQLTNEQYSVIYLAWGLAQSILVSLMGVVMAYAMENASRKYHSMALVGVFQAPISFFDTTPLGRIVNRFSRDTDTMDSSLPMSLQFFISIFFGLVSTLALMCYASPILAAFIAPLGIIYYFMCILYLRTSRELKRLESISRSPVFAHFGESMTGLSTIRAYHRQNNFVTECQVFVDTNNTASLLQMFIQRWLALRLELLGALIVFASAMLGAYAASTDKISAALYGVALSYALQVTGGLSFSVRQAVEVEVSANSIERLNHYAKYLEKEAPAEILDKKPPSDWPNAGEIDVQNLVVKYTKDSEPVIKNISFSTRACEKIGIVGRTGAGKSTITSSMFRLIEPAEGFISIDGINTSDIGLKDLRSKLAIIPQDPVLFSGTVRTNLDPFNEYQDNQIWTVLESINMKTAISKLAEGLEAKVEPNGENFSTGERQLLCLARAMIRKPRVLVVDEGTANVDYLSDNFVQVALRRDFTQSTIISIAHRLNTVIDYDRILVLDRGTIVEYDTPYNLLQIPGGVFATMVEQTGPSNAALLRSMAVKK